MNGTVDCMLEDGKKSSFLEVLGFTKNCFLGKGVQSLEEFLKVSNDFAQKKGVIISPDFTKNYSGYQLPILEISTNLKNGKNLKFVEIYSHKNLKGLPRNHRNLVVKNDFCLFRLLPTAIDRYQKLKELNQDLPIAFNLEKCSYLNAFDYRATCFNDVQRTINDFVDFNICQEPFPRN